MRKLKSFGGWAEDFGGVKERYAHQFRDLVKGQNEVAEMLGFEFRPTFVYAHLDVEGYVLYIGISSSVEDRTRQHREKSDWFKYVSDVQVLEGYPCRKFAEMAEASYIGEHLPIFNKVRPSVTVRLCQILTLREFSAAVNSHVDFGGISTDIEFGRNRYISRPRSTISVVEWFKNDRQAVAA